MPYKVYVRTDDEPCDWNTNSMVYDSRVDAEAAGEKLFQSWLLVQEYKVVEVDADDTAPRPRRLGEEKEVAP